MVGGWAMPEMSVDDDAEAFEVVEVSIDRRNMDLGSFRLHLGAELLGGAMASGIEQRSQQQDAGAGDPTASFSEQRQGAFDRIDPGRGRVGLSRTPGHDPIVRLGLMANKTLLRPGRTVPRVSPRIPTDEESRTHGQPQGQR